MTNTQAKPVASPEDLLKAAVAGKAEEPKAAKTAKVAGRLAVPAWLRRDARLFGAAGAALVLGTVLGAGATALVIPRGNAQQSAVAKLGARLEANRGETARLTGEIAQLHQALTDLRGVTETARKEAASRSGALGERLAQVDRSVATKLAALGDRFDQVEREQNTRIAALAARPAAAPPPAPVVAKPELGKLEPGKPEPAQTGSLADVKAAEAKPADARPADPKTKAATPEKPPVIDGWALRDVYDGTAILENRRRRLVEVAPGDTLPGVGRVEAVERQGRGWIVVTRQGIVTPQPW